MKSKRPISPEQAHANELVDFLQDLALGKRNATEQEVEDAESELNKLLGDATE